MSYEPERKLIPNALIYAVAEVLGGWYYSHTKLNVLFGQNGAPGEPPDGNCVTKCQNWLFRVNKDPEIDPLKFLGDLLVEFMNLNRFDSPAWEGSQKKLVAALEKQGLVYTDGGLVQRNISPAAAGPSETSAEPAKHRFDVAFSFPGEFRPFIEQIADHVSESLTRDRVFYDFWYRHELARPNLDVYLQQIYHDQTSLIVVFLCAAYEEKEWCGLEMRAIRDLIKRKKCEQIMFCRLDAGEVGGTFSTDGYIDVARMHPTDVGAQILSRLALLSGKPSPSSHGSTPLPSKFNATRTALFAAAGGNALTETEAEILVSIPDHGWISATRTDAFGTIINTGGRQFIDPVDPSYQARFIDGFESVAEQGYLREEGDGVFRLTGRGHEVRKRLIAAGIDFGKPPECKA